MDKNILGKKIQLANTNSLQVIWLSIAIFIVIFCFFGVKSLYSEGQYQNRVIKAQNATLSTLSDDLASVGQIEKSYAAFNNLPQNILGGNPNINGDNNGSNSKIILDALPNNIDVPAWSLNINNLDSLLKQQPSFITLDPTSVAVDQAKVPPSLKPIPIPIPLAGSFSAKPQDINGIFDSLYKSLIPIQINSISITAGLPGEPAKVTFKANANYQASYKFSTTTETVQ